jgi:hypothetical protein
VAVYHVHASYIKKGHGSAAACARYIAREGRAEASQLHRYRLSDSIGEILYGG